MRSVAARRAKPRSPFSCMPAISVRPSTAGHYAEIRAELKSAGRPMPSNDLWIAALAREHKCSLVSRDGRFEAIRGIERIGW